MSMLLRALTFSVLVPFAVAGGQSTWSDPGLNDLFELRVARSFLDADGQRLATFAATPAIRFAVGSEFSIEAELPFATASFDDPSPFGDGTISGSRIGNPYLGIVTMVTPLVRLRAGVRYGREMGFDEGALTALAVGVIAEYDRSEAFIPEASSVRGIAEVGLIPEHGGFVQGRFGMTRVMSDGLDGRMLADYGLRIGYVGGGAMIHGGVLGRYWLSGGDAVDANTNQVVVGLSANSGSVRPLVEVRSFVDRELRTAVTAVLSVGLAAEI